MAGNAFRERVSRLGLVRIRGLIQLKPNVFFEGTRAASRTRRGTARVNVRFKVFKSTHDVERRVSISKFASALQNELACIRSRLYVKCDVCVAGVVHQKPRFDDMHADRPRAVFISPRRSPRRGDGRRHRVRQTEVG